MKKDFFKDYSTISPYERFRLVVKALARGDKSFVKRLANSCHTGRSQYARHLNAARECALLVSLDMHVAVGRWEVCNAILQRLNGDHVEYFYTTFRYFPERVEKINAIVSVLEELLIERAMRVDGIDNSDLIERAHEYTEMMTDFLFNEDSEMDGGYVSSVPALPDVILDRKNCQVTCFVLGRAREIVIESIGPLWLAFSSFCRSDMELDPEVVLKAFSLDGVVSFIEDFRIELDDIDPELIDRETESALRDLWRSSTS